MSDNFHLRLREKGGGWKWPFCTSLSSSTGFALFYLYIFLKVEQANTILMRSGTLQPLGGSTSFCRKLFPIKQKMNEGIVTYG